MLDRKLDQGRQIAQAQFPHHPAAICIDGLGRETQNATDSRTGIPFGRQLQNFALAFAQALDQADGATTRIEI
jgi:hypothetical protein